MTLLISGIGTAIPAFILGLAFLFTIGFWEGRFKKAGYKSNNGGYLPLYTVIGVIAGMIAGIFSGFVLMADNDIDKIWLAVIAIALAITVITFVVSWVKTSV